MRTNGDCYDKIAPKMGLFCIYCRKCLGKKKISRTFAALFLFITNKYRLTMRKFTKLMLSLALTFVVAGSVKAKETTVYTKDYSTEADKASAPFWAGDPLPEGSSIKVQGGLLVIENNSDAGNNWDLQLHIGDGIPTTKDLDYKVKVTYKVTYKTTEGGDVTVALGTWGDGNTVPKYGNTLNKSDDFQTMTLDFNGFIRSGSNFIMWQCRSVVGTIYIKKVEVVEVLPDKPGTGYDYGGFSSVTPKMYTKNGGEASGTVSTPDGEGVYKVTSHDSPSTAWDTQFWIGTTEPGLHAGQKFKIKFDYKADKAAKAETQTHGGEAGPYIIWHCIGDVNFTDSWQTFSQTVTVANDMVGWQSVAFNLNVSTAANTYYFRNISLEIQDVIGEYAVFRGGSVGWATFSYDKAVTMDKSGAKAYAAKVNGSSVTLTEVTEIPAKEAVIIEGAGLYTFDVIPSATAITGNDLKVSDGSVTGDGTVYVLAKKDDIVGFYKLKSGSKVPAGKAYLKTSSAAPDYLGLDGEATAVESVKKANVEDGVFYNISGQRVANPTKGLYIVNGKKYVVK